MPQCFIRYLDNPMATINLLMFSDTTTNLASQPYDTNVTAEQPWVNTKCEFPLLPILILELLIIARKFLSMIPISKFVQQMDLYSNYIASS